MTPEESALLSDFGAQLFYAIAALICTCTFYGESLNGDNWSSPSFIKFESPGIYLLATSIAFYLLLCVRPGVSRKVFFVLIILLHGSLAAKEQEVLLAKFFWLALFYFYSPIPGLLWSNALRIWSTSRPRSCRISQEGT